MLLLSVITATPEVAEPPTPPTPTPPGSADSPLYTADDYTEPSVPGWSETAMSGATFAFEYVRGAELPALRLPWADRDGFDIDFSSGWTFGLLIGHLGSLALVSKSSGISGGVGYIDIAWSADPGFDLNTLPVGRYEAQITARRTGDNSDRVRLGEITILTGILG